MGFGTFLLLVAVGVVIGVRLGILALKDHRLKMDDYARERRKMDLMIAMDEMVTDGPKEAFQAGQRDRELHRKEKGG